MGLISRYKHICLVLFGIGIGGGLIGALELTAQLLFWRQYGSFYIHQEFVMSRDWHRAVSDRREFALKENTKTELYTIDVEGFRFSGNAVGDGSVIGIVGDSVPFNYNVNDECTYPYKLQAQINQDGKSSRVLNASVCSYTYWQAIETLYQSIYPRYNPNTIIIHAANDASILLEIAEHKGWDSSVTWFQGKEVRSGNSRYIGVASLDMEFLKNSAFMFYASQETDVTIKNPLFIVPERIFLNLTNFLYEIRTKGVRKVVDTDRVVGIENALISLNSFYQREFKDLSSFVAKRNEDAKILLLPIVPFYYTEASYKKNENSGLYFRLNSNPIAFDKMKLVIRHINQYMEMIAENYSNIEFVDLNRHFNQLENRSEFFLENDFLHYSEKGAEFITKILYKEIFEE